MLIPTEKAFKGDKAKMDKAAQEQFGATIEQLEKAEKLWKEAFSAAAQAKETAPQTKRDGNLFRTIEADGTEVLTTSVGTPVAQMDDNGSAVFTHDVLCI